MFLIGGLTGPPLGSVATDLQLHDTYYVVGHFHATMFGGFVFPFFAALYYWYPKAIGRQYNERWGVVHFALMTPAFWVMSLGQMLAGTRGMRRRVADYDRAWGIDVRQWRGPPGRKVRYGRSAAFAQTGFYLERQHIA